MPTSFGTILVVDDSTTMRNVIKKILEPVGYANKIKPQVDRMGKMTAKLPRVTTYRTKAHDGLPRIIDMDGAAPGSPVEA